MAWVVCVWVMWAVRVAWVMWVMWVVFVAWAADQGGMLAGGNTGRGTKNYLEW